jgi:hypothetical protein
MTDINLIIDNIEPKENNYYDKLIEYEDLNKSLQFYKYNNTKLYNHTLYDFYYLDNYVEYFSNLSNSNNDIKKILVKKLLIFNYPKTESIVKKQNIIHKNSINLSYPINAYYNKIINNKKKLKSYIIPNGIDFNLYGLSNSKDFEILYPFQLNPYKFEHKFLLNLYPSYVKINDDIYTIYNKDFMNNLNNDKIKSLYRHLISEYNYSIDNISLIKNNNIISNPILQYNIPKFDSYIDKKYIDNYLPIFNNFLNFKINKYFSNHSYYSFYFNGLLELYEDILLYSIDNLKVKSKITQIIKEKENLIVSNKNNQFILNYKLKQNELEYLTKIKFPNLFNPNSKEFLFKSNYTFDFNKLSKKYQDIILLDYKKLQNYKNEYINNNCPHKALLYKFYKSYNKEPLFKDVVSLIKDNSSTKDNNDYYKCIKCSFDFICPHIVDYYTLLFDKSSNKSDYVINQIILQKYNLNKKQINDGLAKITNDMINYCKICGEEISKSPDLEQNIEYKDNIKLNTGEYSDANMELVKRNASYIIYTYIVFNDMKLRLTKNYLINHITDNIVYYIDNLERNLRKSKKYNESEIQGLLSLNATIFIYSNLIFIMIKYPEIDFRNQNKSIITTKKGSKSTNVLLFSLKEKFKIAYKLIISSNNVLLNNLKYNSKLDEIQQLLIKSYGLISTNSELVISNKNIKKINLDDIFHNNHMFNYFKIFKLTNDYPIKNTKNYLINSLPFDFQLQTYNNINLEQNINYINDFKLKNINLVKEFDNLSNVTIKNYNDFKYYSFLSFYYHIYYELYNYPIYEILDNSNNKNNLLSNKVLNNNLETYNFNTIIKKEYNKYIIYLKALIEIKKYELTLINSNIEYYLYPYSFIPLNNNRYFYNKNVNLNLNSYYCNDGYEHKFNNYVYNVNNKNIIINKKDLDKFINNNSKFNFIEHQCIKCLKTENELKEKNPDIDDILESKTNINGFFNLYLNLCPLKNKNNKYDYHNFIDKNNDLTCSNCNIKYIDLLNKNINTYKQFKNKYIEYKKEHQNDINQQLSQYDKQIKNNKIIIELSNKFKNIIDDINALNLDNLIISISSKFKINNKYLEILGLTEHYSYEDVINIQPSYDNISNRLSKLISYVNNIHISINLLKYNTNIKKNFYEQDLYNLLIKYINSSKKLIKILPNTFNFIDLINQLKNYTDNENLIKFCLKYIYNIILTLVNINEKELDEFIKYIIFKILKFDELFTNYNYSQLKQMFSEYADGNFILDENPEYDDNDDEDDLFEYNKLNIEFDDEDQIDN